MTSLTLLTALCACALLPSTQGFIVLQPGACPNVPPMEGFDLNRYMGRWYAIESFDAPYQAFSYCIQANYEIFSADRVRVINRGYRGLRVGKSLWFASYTEADGFASIRNQSIPSALNVEFPGADISSGVTVGDASTRVAPNYVVVDTDYDNYAVVWSCVPLVPGFLRVDTAWILGREPLATPVNTPSLKANLASYGIQTRFFKKIYQDLNVCEEIRPPL